MSDITMMTAVVIDGEKGPPEALRLSQIARPAVAPGQLLIRVHAAGVNRPDLLQRMGLYPPPPGASGIMGLEVAGVVVVPAGRWKAGDRVCALLPGGGYAGFATCDPDHALPIPDGMSYEEAASLPETMFTVYANVFECGTLCPGETLLVHGATSGIGVMAIQMAKAFGARVIATGRGTDKALAALELGADISVDTRSRDFAEVTKIAGGADVILSMVGADYFAQNLDALNRGGRIVFIAALGGGEITVPVLPLMRKNATLTGSTLRGRPDEEKRRLAKAIEATVYPWITAGLIKPIVDRVFPITKVADAHRYLEQGQHRGKVVLSLAHGDALAD